MRYPGTRAARSIGVQVLICSLLALLSQQALATAALKGIVLRNEIGGAPLAGVQITADGANPTVTDSTGRFALEFPQKVPGDTVRLVVTREDWSVVNDVQLDRELPGAPDSRAVEVLMSKASERREWALVYYRVRGNEVVNAEYDRKLVAAASLGSNERELLVEERNRAREQADELAHRLANVDPDQFDADIGRVQRLFLGGRLDDALQILSSSRLAQNGEQAARVLSQTVNGYVLRGRLLEVKFQFDEAGAAYAEAVKLAPEDYDAQKAYGDFSVSQRRFEQARAVYEKVLARQWELEKTDAEVARPRIAKLLARLGWLYIEQDACHARVALEKAFEFYSSGQAGDPAKFRLEIAVLLTLLGVADAERKQYASARHKFDKAVDTWGSGQDSAAINRLGRAFTLDAMANMYAKQGKYGKALSYVEEALRISREVRPPDDAPVLAAREMVAHFSSNVCVLNHNRERDVIARTACNEALTIYQSMAQKNPERYSSEVQRVQALLDQISG